MSLPVNMEFAELVKVKNMPGYKILENEWLHQVTNIEARRSKAAKSGQESAWRFWAGQEEGFKLAMTTLERALVRMQDEGGVAPENTVDKLLEEIKKSQ